MADTDPDDVLLQLPADLAYDLMDLDVVRPYVRTDRVDPELLYTLVLTAGTAMSTAVATKLTDGVAAAIGKAVRGWFKGRKADDRLTLTASGGDSLVIDENTTEEEIAEFARRARERK